MKTYHDLYQNEDGKWCVSYTENEIKNVECFENKQDAVNFYMS